MLNEGCVHVLLEIWLGLAPGKQPPKLVELLCFPSNNPEKGTQNKSNTPMHSVSLFGSVAEEDTV